MFLDETHREVPDISRQLGHQAYQAAHEEHRGLRTGGAAHEADEAEHTAGIIPRHDICVYYIYYMNI